ncbi:MAG TPA: DUF2207 domain-containing protein [Streptosporangiaceae bacterium]
MRARFARLAGVSGLAVPVVLLALIPAAQASTTSGAVTAAASSGGEQITSYHISVTIRPDGVTHVREAIAYDFGTNQRHGIYRDILDRLPASGGREQEFPIRNITVSSPDGAPTLTTVSRRDDELMIRVGDPARTITGRHRYLLSYDIGRALTPVPDAGTDMLYWDLIGTDWTVPIRHVVATVRGPGALSDVVCYAGATGSHARCGSMAVTGKRARFTQAALTPGQGLTISVFMPSASVQAGPPLLVKPDASLAQLKPTPLSAVLAVVAVLLMWTWPWLLATGWRRRAAHAELPRELGGRARPGGHPGHTGLAAAQSGRIIRPAEADVVRSGQIVARHIAATIVDLAIRGYLRIEDLPGIARVRHAGTGQPTGHDAAAGQEASDWQLIRQAPLPSASAGPAGSRGGLLPYEEMLLRELFAGRDQVRVKELKESFRAPVRRVCAQLSRDVQRQGWLKLKNSEARGWKAAAWAAVVVGAAGVLTGLEVPALPGAGFFGAVVGAAGLLTILVTPSLRRAKYQYTARGQRLLDDLRPARQQLAEDPLAPAVSPWTQFSALLPYAIALGLAEQWTRRFTAMPVPAQTSGWLPAGMGSTLIPGWYFTAFTHQVCQLAPHGYLSVPVAGTRAAEAYSPPYNTGIFGSRGGGFSGGDVGGGGGGGGGGSW